MEDFAGMIVVSSLERAAFVGTIVQLLMYVLGHFVPWIAANVFGFGGVMIAATAAYLYAREVALGYGRGALGGAVVGFICAAIGVLFAYYLHDLDRRAALVGASAAVLTGAVGGVFGQLSTRTP